jgi:DNA-directed RNA polymerase alpha subunit
VNDADGAESPADAAAEWLRNGYPTDDESWKTVSLHDLTMPGTTAQKLEEAEIRTLGDLAAWNDSGKLLTDIKGVGEKAAEKIEAALDEFWGSR